MLIRKRSFVAGGKKFMIAFRLFKGQVTDTSLKDWWEVKLKDDGLTRGGAYVSVTVTTGRTSKKYEGIARPGRHLLVASVEGEEIVKGLMSFYPRSQGWTVADLGSPSKKIRRRNK